MTFDQAKDVLLSGALLLIAGYVASQIRKVVESINELNIKIAQVITIVSTHKETLGDHGHRLLKLEHRNKG